MTLNLNKIILKKKKESYGIRKKIIAIFQYQISQQMSEYVNETTCHENEIFAIF